MKFQGINKKYLCFFSTSLGCLDLAVLVDVLLSLALNQCLVWSVLDVTVLLASGVYLDCFLLIMVFRHEGSLVEAWCPFMPK